MIHRRRLLATFFSTPLMSQAASVSEKHPFDEVFYSLTFQLLGVSEQEKNNYSLILPDIEKIIFSENRLQEIQQLLYFIQRYCLARFKQPFTQVNVEDAHMLIDHIWQNPSHSQHGVLRWLHYIGLEAFYSHPTSWDAIGFKGPPQPFGYVNHDR